jgi:hypothetical protein
MFGFQRQTSLLAAVAAVWLASGRPAPAQTPPVAPPPSEPSPTLPGLVEILQDKPTFYVRADVARVSRRYREGEAIELTVVSEADAYLYVLYQQADGKVVQIYPNSGTADNRIGARQTVSIPGENDRFAWTIGAPYGKEIIKVIAAKEPLAKLDDPSLRKQMFAPVEDERLKALAVELQSENRVAWGTDQVDLATFAKDAGPDVPKGRRIGVFFGVSEYRFHAEAKAAAPNGSGMNLKACHRDARRMTELMQSEGRLDLVRTFVNEQATRDNLEQVVTQWLPAASQPGDTVFIYFSGHGGQIPDADGDEQDRQDEFLLPHDFLGPEAVDGLLQKAQRGELDPAKAKLAATVAELMKKAPSPQAMKLALMHASGVTDDLFGHWVQRLAGRQVVVILDICHSGGFSAREKDLSAAAKAGSFDFVDGEFTRLKDLGQRDMALLAACESFDTAQERPLRDMGVFTYSLAEVIETADRTTTLENAFEYCRVQMARHFEEENAQNDAAGKPRKDGHKPVMLNLCTKPVVMKP